MQRRPYAPARSAKGAFRSISGKPDLQAIRARDLDFVLRFAFGIIRGPVLESARYGVWSFHHGDPEKYRGGPYCFWNCAARNRAPAWSAKTAPRSWTAALSSRAAACLPPLKGSPLTGIVRSNWVSVPVEVCRDIHCGNTSYIDGPPLAAPANSTLRHPIWRCWSGFSSAPSGCASSSHIVCWLTRSVRGGCGFPGVLRGAAAC